MFSWLRSRPYLSKVNADLFTELEDVLRNRFYSSDVPFVYAKIAIPHKMVVLNNEYTRTSGPQSPDAMLEQMVGDCEDNAVLLASMYDALDLDCLISRLANRDGDGHLATFVEIPETEVETGCDRLRRYYYEEIGEFYETISYEWRDGQPWFVSGSTMTDYVGDISGLENQGYVARSGPDEWEWTELTWYREV